MTVLEMMQRVRSKESTLIMDYIREAIREVQQTTHENKKTAYINIVAGVSEYNYPEGMDTGQKIDFQVDKDVTNYSNYYWESNGRTFFFNLL